MHPATYTMGCFTGYKAKDVWRWPIALHNEYIKYGEGDTSLGAYVSCKGKALPLHCNSSAITLNTANRKAYCDARKLTIMYENLQRSWKAQRDTRKPATIHKISLIRLFYSFFYCSSPTSCLLHINLNYILKFSYESSKWACGTGFPHQNSTCITHFSP